MECAEFLNTLAPEPLPPPVPEPEPLPVPPPEPPPPVPAKRSAYREPGHPTDAINSPIGSNAKFAPNAHFDPPKDFPVGYNVERDIVILVPDATLIDVLPNAGGFDANADRFKAISTTPIARIRCPRTFSYTDHSEVGMIKGNSCAYALMGDNRTVVHLYNFAMKDGKAFAKFVQEWPREAYEKTGKLIDGPLYYGAHGGSRLRSGTIRVGEFTTGPAMHALSIIMPSARRFRVQPPIKDGAECLSYDVKNTWITPALQGDKWDTYGGTDPYVRAGTRYALPEDISGRMLTQAGKWIAQTLYWFGCYDVDAGAGQPGFAWSHEPGPDGREVKAMDVFESVHKFSPRQVNWSGYPRAKSTANAGQNGSNFVLDMDLMFRSLRAVLDNRPGQWGGAGVPRAPLKGAPVETF